MRNFFIVTHRWVALISAAFLVVIGLSGAAVEYQPQIDRLANPGLWRASGVGRPLDFDTLVARVRASLPGVPIDELQPAAWAGEAAVLTSGDDQVFADPVNGRVLGRRTGAQVTAGLAHRIEALHTSLLGGKVGGAIVYLATLAALYLALTGIILWWPDRIFAVHWSASWKRINFDIHHVLGILSSLVLAAMAGTGITMTTGPISRFITSHGGTTARPRAKQPPADSLARPISLAAVAAVARARMPGATLTALRFPADPGRPFEAQLQFPEDRSHGGGRTLVQVDRYRGTVLAAVSSREVAAGSRMIYLVHAWHSGDFLGTPTRLLWGLCSIVLATQALTGFLMWLNARKGRQTA